MREKRLLLFLCLLVLPPINLFSAQGKSNTLKSAKGSEIAPLKITYPPDVIDSKQKIEYCLEEMKSAEDSLAFRIESDYWLSTKKSLEKYHYVNINHPDYNVLLDSNRMYKRPEISPMFDQYWSEIPPLIQFVAFPEFKHVAPRSRLAINAFVQLSGERKLLVDKWLDDNKPYFDVQCEDILRAMERLYNVVQYINNSSTQPISINELNEIVMKPGKHLEDDILNYQNRYCLLEKEYYSLNKKSWVSLFPSFKKDLGCGFTLMGINVQDWEHTTTKAPFVKIIGEAINNNSISSPQRFKVKVYDISNNPQTQTYLNLNIPNGKSEFFEVELDGLKTENVGAILIECAD